MERWYSIEDGSGGLWEGGAAAEQIRKGEGSTMKNANRIPETFQTDAEYRQWMERWQQEAREATIEGFITFQGTLSSWWTSITIAALLCFFIVLQSILAMVKKKK